MWPWPASASLLFFSLPFYNNHLKTMDCFFLSEPAILEQWGKSSLNELCLTSHLEAFLSSSCGICQRKLLTEQVKDSHSHGNQLELSCPFPFVPGPVLEADGFLCQHSQCGHGSRTLSCLCSHSGAVGQGLPPWSLWSLYFTTGDRHAGQWTLDG